MDGSTIEIPKATVTLKILAELNLSALIFLNQAPIQNVFLQENATIKCTLALIQEKVIYVKFLLHVVCLKTQTAARIIALIKIISPTTGSLLKTIPQRSAWENQTIRSEAQ